MRESPDEAKSINVEGTRVVAQVAGKGLPVVFASTCSCYGAVGSGLCTEDTPLRPVSLYGQTKVEAESILREHANAVIYRIATAYGLAPQMRWDLLVNDFTKRALEDETLKVYEGSFRRSFLHVRDIARGFIMAAEKHPELAGSAWNLGDEHANLTKLQLCEKIAQVVPEFRYEESPDGKDADQRNYAVSYDRIYSKGFRPVVTFVEGIEELASTLS